MDLSDLNIFQAVARAGGITRAAAQLNRVQSNITTRIKQLEADLGVDLFLRDGKQMRLSPSGQILLGYANRLQGLAQEAREAISDTEPRGLLRLGSMESTAAARLPRPLAEFHRLYPDVKLELHTAPTLKLVNRVLEGELEAAFVAEPVSDERLEKRVIYAEELVIVAESQHPPIRSPHDIRNRTLLAFEPGCAYRKRLEDWLQGAELLPDRIVEFTSYHAILGCVLVGMGVAILPRAVLELLPEKESLSVHALPPEKTKTNTVLIWRSGAKSARISAMLDVIQRQP